MVSHIMIPLCVMEQLRRKNEGNPFSDLFEWISLLFYYSCKRLWRGLPFTLSPMRLKTNSLNIEFDQANQSRVNFVGSLALNPSCIYPVFPSVEIIVSKIRSFSSSSMLVIP